MRKFIKELIPYVIILVVVILIRSFIATPVVVKGASMEDTLLEGEVLILNKITYHFNDIKRFDIVVLDESNLELASEDKLIIKRVIGLPGEYVEYKDNILYIDGKEVADNYGKDVTGDFSLSDISNSKTIPEDKYLVLGDNRTISKDSRIIGLINKEDIKGKANFRLFPFTKFGKVK